MGFRDSQLEIPTFHAVVWVQLHAGLKFQFQLTWRIAELFTWINKRINLSWRLNEVESIFRWLWMNAGLVKVNCLIREVPEHFIWVFLNLPLVYHAFLSPQLHPLPRFKKQWSMLLKWTWDFDLGYHICRRHSFYAGQGLLQNFPLELTSAQICLDEHSPTRAANCLLLGRNFLD